MNHISDSTLLLIIIGTIGLCACRVLDEDKRQTNPLESISSAMAQVSGLNSIIPAPTTASPFNIFGVGGSFGGVPQLPQIPGLPPLPGLGAPPLFPAPDLQAFGLPPPKPQDTLTTCSDLTLVGLYLGLVNDYSGTINKVRGELECFFSLPFLKMLTGG